MCPGTFWGMSWQRDIKMNHFACLLETWKVGSPYFQMTFLGLLYIYTWSFGKMNVLPSKGCTDHYEVPLFIQLLLPVSRAERLLSSCLIQKTSVLGEQVVLHLPWWSQDFNCAKWLTEKTSPCKYFKTKQKKTNVLFLRSQNKTSFRVVDEKNSFLKYRELFLVGFPEAFKGDIAVTWQPKMAVCLWQKHMAQWWYST